MTYGRIILTSFLVQVFTTHVANSFVPFYPNTNAVGTTRTSRRVPSLSLSASKKDLDFDELDEAAKKSGSFLVNSFMSFYGTTRKSQRNPSLSLDASKRDLNFEELQEAAKNPASFEAYVLQKNSPKERETVEPPPAKPTNGKVEPPPAKPTNGKVEPPPAKPSNGKGYVPIEVWDEQRKEDNASSEERVQFEARANGDRFKQNEILRKNLNGY